MSRTSRLLLRAVTASCSATTPAAGWARMPTTASAVRMSAAASTSSASSSSRASSSLTTTAAEEGGGDGKVTRSLIVDTLNLMRSFEAAGLSRQQAEALTRTVTAVVQAAKEDSSGAYVTKGALHTALLERDARLAGFRAEVGKAAELQAAALTRDTERLGAALDRVRAELRAEVDKATAAQRLDLNLERARLRDDLQALRDKGAELEIKVDKETSALRALMESTKNEMIKYGLGVLLTLSTIGLGVARMLGMGR